MKVFNSFRDNIFTCVLFFYFDVSILSSENIRKHEPFVMDQAVECLKNILDSNQCRICDKAEGSRLRYPCGHTACDTCVVEAPDCLICVTPPKVAAADKPFTLRAKNALALKETFEDAFDIDVYKRLRLSEQLKIERELFPTCIQAPATYCNKRKSINNSENKENILAKKYPLQYPGQEISSTKMDTEKNKYLQQWLDNIDKRHRKPFADIDVNRSAKQQNAQVKKRADKILDKVYERYGFQAQKIQSNKRTHFKKSLSLVNSQSKLKKYLKPLEKQETPKWTAKKFKEDFDPPEQPLNIKNNDKDESGIVMDDEVISINDSQSQVVDKDREAWLAVLKAADKDVSELTPNLLCSENIRYTLDVENTSTPQEPNSSTSTKIPFNKQRSPSKSYQYCDDVLIETDQNETAGQSKKVSITIENNSFVATITVSTDNKSVESNMKQSVHVQTDIHSFLENESIETKSNDEEISKRCVEESQDLFTAEGSQEKNQVDNVTEDKSTSGPNIIKISDSDSDDDLNQSSVIEVTAEVHRTSGELDNGVLSEINVKELGSRNIPKKRGKTPASSDSSEKENFDPNKSKRMKLEKKSSKKRKAKKTKLK